MRVSPEGPEGPEEAGERRGPAGLDGTGAPGSPSEPLAPVLMVQGTASGVGKSLLTAAFCRILARRGYRVAPFKAQNMSNNAAVTVAGGEIGRAQALQARAAGVEAHVRMNPVLLKPMADTRSEVVLLGRGVPELSAVPWRERRPHLWPTVARALDELRGEVDVVVAEGAGSPAETNLRESDIVNMSVAHQAGAVVVLVADIDRGGAFASLYGTWALLDEADRGRIRGFLLNRFRGDASLLAPAPATLEARTGVPVVGVVPWMRHLLPEEDGGPALGVEPTENGGRSAGSPRRVGVIRFPHLANVDDLDPLRAEAGVSLHWILRPADLFGVEALLLPGSRNTPADLGWLHASGVGDGIRALHRAGTPILGLCAGYQMLGSVVRDPEGIELEGGGEMPGLGLLPLETTLAPGKATRLTRARVLPHAPGLPGLPPDGIPVEGYEIHHGRTRALDPGCRPWIVAEGVPGASAEAPGAPAEAPDASGDAPEVLGHGSPGVLGAYLHGLLENAPLRHAWLRGLGVDPSRGEAGPWGPRLDAELDRLADGVAASVEVDRILGWLGLDPRPEPVPGDLPRPFHESGAAP
jgi:adenosylcobyric acid synthase